MANIHHSAAVPPRNLSSVTDTYEYILQHVHCTEPQAGPESGHGSILEYQAMPSLRDIAHDGWLCVYIFYTTAAGNSISSQLGSSCQGNRYGVERAGSTARPSRTKSHLPSQSPPVSQAGSRIGPAH